MEWNEASDDEGTALTRIVSLLLALADLAELTVHRSPALRVLVLWLLLPAEAMVRNLVTDAPAPFPFHHGGLSRADAVRLARRFRNLARAVEHSAASAVRHDGIGQVDPAWAVSCRTLHRAGAQSLGCALPAPIRDSLGVVIFPDTS